MRAAVADEYGGPEVLQVREVDDPKVGPDYVLIRVEAASINPVDYKIVAGRLDGAFPVTWPLIPGWDVVGEVVGMGPAVRGFEEGQRVFGYARKDLVGTGSWAERTALHIRAVAPAPESTDPEAASCLPLAGMTAWQVLVEVLEVGEGDTVLIHGATGGVGHLGTQIARSRGARVIGTCSDANHDFLRELGGEPVTYGEGLAERLREAAPDGVDAVADLAGRGALDASDEVLGTPGRLVSITDAQAAKERGGTYLFVRPDVRHLAALTDLVEDGQLTPHVQAVHDLDDVQDAVREASSGSGVRGKVVLRVQ